MASPPPFAGRVASLGKGLAVICAFGEDNSAATISSMAEATGMDRASVRRYLLTLAELGYVSQEGRTFRLAPKVLELGFSFLGSQSWLEVVQPLIEDLSRTVDESASIAMASGDEIVYVSRAPSTRILSVTLNIGARLPAAATSMGRVLIASLPRAQRKRLVRRIPLPRYTKRTITNRAAFAREIEKVRKQGYCLIDGELEDVLISAAVPIVANGQAVAALNIAASRGRAGSATMRSKILPHLRTVAAQIGDIVGKFARYSAQQLPAHARKRKHD